MVTHEENGKKLTKRCLAKSKGNWNKLCYKVIDAERMIKFVEIITTYGNSVQCKQQAVDEIENILIKYSSFAAYKAIKPEIVQYGLARGFAYLFASLTVKVNNVSCPKVYVKHNLTEDTSSIVLPYASSK